MAARDPLPAAPAANSGEPAAPRRMRRHGFGAAPRPMGQAYSRYVRGMKLLLLAVAAVVVTLLIAWPQLDVQESAPAPEALKARTDDADSLRMLNPRYVGVDSENRPFTVTAQSTSQTGPGGQRVSLERPQADMTLTDGAWVSLMADHGVYDRDDGTLFLTGDVQLFHDQGYQFQSESARVDLKAGAASGDRPVRVQGPAGFLAGQGFRIEDHGKTVTVTGRSALRLDPAVLKRTTDAKGSGQ